MNKNYLKGYALEHRTKKFLETKGYQVIRSPASKSSYDLMAVGNHNKLFVQCKKTSHEVINTKGLMDVMRDAETVDGTPVIVYAFQNTPLYARTITQDHLILKRDDAHIKLEDFLKDYSFF